MKPIIGITLDIEPGPPAAARVQTAYYEAICRTGGIPVLIPPLPDHDLHPLLERVDGLVLIGGNDYSPSLYGEQPHQAVIPIDPRREEFDLRLSTYAINQTRLPILGICGGLQILNISLGGSLFQDIPSQLPGSTVKHSKENGWLEGFQKHHVTIDPASQLSRIYGVAAIDVASSHHQAVKELGAGLVASSHAEDGVIESVELPGRGFTVGVQWHPERDFQTNRRLFEQFVAAAAASKQAGLCR